MLQLALFFLVAGAIERETAGAVPMQSWIRPTSPDTTAERAAA